MAIAHWSIVVLAGQEMAREVFSDYLKRLIDSGIERLGKGGSASVFQHPEFSNIVVKIGLAKSDSQAYEWLEWCHAHRNPYAPLVYSVGELKAELPARYRNSSNPPKMFIAFMERLTPADPKVVRDFFAQYPDVFPRLEARFWGFRPKNIKNISDKDLAVILRVIDSFKHCDFKADNVMLRGNQIVFSDPIY
jgi:hypothetical protein